MAIGRQKILAALSMFVSERGVPLRALVFWGGTAVLLSAHAQVPVPNAAQIEKILNGVRLLVDGETYLNKDTIEQALGISLAPINCVHYPKMEPEPQFVCEASAGAKTAEWIVNYAYRTHALGDLINNGTVRIALRRKDLCLRVSDVEASFSKTAVLDATIIYEPPRGSLKNYVAPRDFTFEYGGLERPIYVIGLHVEHGCVSDISIR